MEKSNVFRVEFSKNCVKEILKRLYEVVLCLKARKVIALFHKGSLGR